MVALININNIIIQYCFHFIFLIKVLNTSSSFEKYSSYLKYTKTNFISEIQISFSFFIFFNPSAFSRTRSPTLNKYCSYFFPLLKKYKYIIFNYNFYIIFYKKIRRDLLSRLYGNFNKKFFEN